MLSWLMCFIGYKCTYKKYGPEGGIDDLGHYFQKTTWRCKHCFSAAIFDNGVMRDGFR